MGSSQQHSSSVHDFLVLAALAARAALASVATWLQVWSKLYYKMKLIKLLIETYVSNYPAAQVQWPNNKYPSLLSASQERYGPVPRD